MAPLSRSSAPSSGSYPSLIEFPFLFGTLVHGVIQGVRTGTPTPVAAPPPIPQPQSDFDTSSVNHVNANGSGGGGIPAMVYSMMASVLGFMIYLNARFNLLHRAFAVLTVVLEGLMEVEKEVGIFRSAGEGLSVLWEAAIRGTITFARPDSAPPSQPSSYATHPPTQSDTYDYPSSPIQYAVQGDYALPIFADDDSSSYSDSLSHVSDVSHVSVRNLLSYAPGPNELLPNHIISLGKPTMPIVPPEIVSAIMSQVTFRDLPACALASKLLLPSARENLYSSIRLMFLDRYSQRPGAKAAAGWKLIQQHSQVLLLATLKRRPNLGSLVRELTSANENGVRQAWGETEDTYKSYLRVCPNVDSITYRGNKESYPGEADAVVRAVLAVKPSLRELSILHLDSPLASKFLKAYSHLETLGIIVSRFDEREPYPPAASWPANLTTLKFDADKLSQTAFDTITTNSSRTITSLHLFYPHTLPHDTLDLSALSALTKLALKGVESSSIKSLASTCKSLKYLLVQCEGEASSSSLRQLLNAVPPTVHLLALRSHYPIPLQRITKFITAGKAPDLREVWVSLARNEVEVGWGELVAASVAKGVVAWRKDWDEESKPVWEEDFEEWDDW
ncbi:hypothetical protein RQP46_001472 [Phenoliferia psychrophenolica]